MDCNKTDLAIIAFALIFTLIVASSVFFQQLEDNKALKSQEEYENTMAKKNDTVWAVRTPAVAGQFYPADAKQLESMIKEFMDEVDVYESNKPRAIISPHAGYIYSGLTASYGYKQLQGRSYKTVIVLAPSHFAHVSASIPNASHYETPLGLIPISPIAVELEEKKIIKHTSEAHDREHSLEVQLPFLQVMLGDFQLVPIVMGNVNPAEFAKKLEPYVDDDTLIIASSDLSHYHPYAEANSLDTSCVNHILTLDLKDVANDELCGVIPVMTVMEIARMRGWTPKLMDYRTSGDTAGDKNQVVGYASIVFHDGLNSEEEEFLLTLARDTLEKRVRFNETPKVDESRLTERLKADGACFVTYHENGDLRGCIGHLEARMPLYKCVMENAVNAAIHDPRFNPVKEAELDEIGIEVSVLTPPAELPHKDADDLLEKLTPLRDGVIIQSGYYQSTYLPQVWEQIPNKKEFLSQLCMKGGAGRDCWKNPETKILTYQAQVFSEKKETK